MTTQLKLVAVGHLSPTHDEIVCLDEFAATWHEGLDSAIDSVPPDYPALFADDTLEDIYHLGLTDRDLGLPSHALDYGDRDERAAYTAGKCAARRVPSFAWIEAQLEQLRDAMDDEAFWAHHCQ